MGIIAKEEQKIPSAPEGMHNAICYGVYDLGTQENKKFGKMQRKVLLQWELTDIRIDIEKDGIVKNLPKAISKEYTLSLYKSNLKKDLESWRGKTFTEEEKKGFDITVLAGLNCTLQIMHSECGQYANIATVLPGKSTSKAENPIRVYSIGETIPDGTPQWIIDKIMESAEMNKGETYNQAEPDQQNEFSGGLATANIDDYERPPVNTYEEQDDIPY